MSTTSKKAYVYKMKLGPANVLCILIFLLCYIPTIILRSDLSYGNIKLDFFIVLLCLILYLGFHEVLHGIGYLVGGCKSKNIQYGVCLEKGIFYAMAYQELTKKNILISLQMPFMVIGVITYIISYIFGIPLLMFLSIVNLSGASMDLAMFIYISRLKNVTYSESGQPDEFVLISDNDLTKKKSIFLKVVDVKDYKKEDYVFPKRKKIVISKASFIILLVLLGLGIVNMFL